MIRLIAAIDSKRGIAKQGKMPWHIPEDEKYFTEQTKLYGAHVLSGSVTFHEAYKDQPLKDRHNYILTHHTDSIPGVTLVHDLAKFLDSFRDRDLWVAGGAGVFDAVMKLGKADELYLTEIEGDFGCDRFFPDFTQGFKQSQQSDPVEQNGFQFCYSIYTKIT